MTNTFGVSANQQSNDQTPLGGPGAQDTTQLLQKIMFGRVVGASPFGYAGVSAVVVKNPNPSQVEVLVDNWDKTGASTFTANYEPRYDWPSGVKTQVTPPIGTPCLIAFAANGDHTPWVTAFGNWP